MVLSEDSRYLDIDTSTSGLKDFSFYHADPELAFQTDGTIPYLREVLSIPELIEKKRQQGLLVHIIIPTLNEGTQTNGISNIGTTLDNLHMLSDVGLVDTIEVYDSGSADDTKAEVLGHGVAFYDTSRILEAYGLSHHPDGQRVSGKGSNIWAAIINHHRDNDLIFSVDADFGVRASQIQGIISPLIEDPDTQVSHPLFIRSTRQGDANGKPIQGGRVTRLVFQPLVTKHFPELYGLIDPVAGAYGFRASLARNLDLPHAFGVDVRFAIAGAMAVREGNPNAIAQVFTGEKSQTGKTTDALSVMSAAMGHVTDRLAERTGRVFFPHPQPDCLLIPTHSITRSNDTHVINTATKKIPFLYLPPPAQVLNGNSKGRRTN